MTDEEFRQMLREAREALEYIGEPRPPRVIHREGCRSYVLREGFEHLAPDALPAPRDVRGVDVDVSKGHWLDAFKRAFWRLRAAFGAPGPEGE